MISIIIPTLNEKRDLRKTLENLKSMKSTEYELIISDGRSIDGTIDIAKEYTDKVMVYEGTERQTIADGRNLGASVAQGEYLVFIDADVIIPNLDDFFKKMLEEFSKETGLCGATVSIRVFPEMETWADRFFFGLLNLTNLLNNNALGIGSTIGEFQMIKADLFRKIGGFDKKLIASEDFEFFSRLAKCGKTRYVRGLRIFHTGRRPHKVGWIKLMSTWILNNLYVKLFKKAYSKEWKEVR